MKIVFLIFINLVFNFSAVSQCVINSTCGYNVVVNINPTSIVPSTLTCPYGYNYNVTFDYSITITGINTCYNGNIGIQPQIFCNGGQNNGYYTINIAAPTVGSGSSSITHNGTLTTTTNQYANLTDCNTATPSSLGCNTFDIHIFGPGIPSQTINCNQSVLPIELLSFSASITDNHKVKLNWQTASEINNDYFTIERSTNGFDWEEIKKIDGSGNSSSNLNYSTIDENPYKGLSFYRLKQTDFDGQFDSSIVRSVNFENIETNNIQLYPNPTSDQIVILGDKLELSEINIFNTLGQNVNILTTIQQNEKKVTIDMSILSTGMYYIKTKTTANKVYKQ